MTTWREFNRVIKHDRRECEAGRHIINATPEITLGGWYVWACIKCPYRWRVEKTVPGEVINNVGELG